MRVDGSVSGKKKLRIQKYLHTCGLGLRLNKLREVKPPALFTNLNVTCAVQVMLVSRAGTYINVLKSTVLANIFARNIDWPRRILERILRYSKNVKTS